jgi:hypothetical protein
MEKPLPHKYIFGPFILIILLVVISGCFRDKPVTSLLWAESSRDDLQSIPSISLTSGKPEKERFYILGTVDHRHYFYPNESFRYPNTIQIIDGTAPWPPVWFMITPVDASEKALQILTGGQFIFGGNDRFIFFSPVRDKDSLIRQPSYIIINKYLTPIDTFRWYNKRVDQHDFREGLNKQKLYFVQYDTVVDISRMYKPDDTAVTALVNEIELTDSAGRLLLRWDPLKQLGFDAMFFPYRYAPSITYDSTLLDWSHANGISWDWDENILYSFRHIGIGKISSKDGHVIWRIDRKKQKPNFSSDSIPFFLQHDLKVIDHQGPITTYSVFSNGDKLHPYCYGIVFTVDELTQKVSLKNLVYPSKSVLSYGHGNFELNAEGRYLLNYGICGNDTAADIILFETGNVNRAELVTYAIAPVNVSYRVYELTNCVPPRPQIIQIDKFLRAKGNMKNWVWYQLSGNDCRTVKKVGNGSFFSPQRGGVYCVTGEYGIGYSVSAPFLYKL